MYSYDAYKEKILKLKKVKHTIYKYRVLIMSSIVVGLGIATTFISISGIITVQPTLDKDTYTYGEFDTYQNLLKSECLFGKVSYQFKEEDSSIWKDSKPSKPGSYEVRAVSTRAFGIKNYSSSVNLTITPVEGIINANSNYVVYGNALASNTNFLQLSDKVENIDFEYEDLSKKKTTVTPLSDSLKIISKDNEDVTAFYDLEPKTTDITIGEKDIYISPKITSKVYDGREISYDNEITDESKSYLVSEDTISFTSSIKDSSGKVLSTNPTNAGNYSVIFNNDLKMMRGDIDTTIHYNIHYVNNSFTISKRPIVVYTGSSNKEYDGSELENEAEFGTDSQSQYDLVENQNYYLISGYKTNKNVGSYSNYLSVGIKDEEGNIVTSNYNIFYNYGKLSITQRAICIRPKDIEVTYSDQDYVYDTTIGNYELVSGSLVSGEEIGISSTYYTLNGARSNARYAGNYLINISGVYGNSNTSTSNYNISYNTSGLTIDKQILRINLSSMNDTTYDGNNVNYNANSYVPVGTDYIYNYHQSINITTSYYKNGLKVDNMKNAGDYQIKFVSAQIYGSDGSNVTSSYDLSCLNETSLTINKRNATIAPNTYYVSNNNYEYDGTEKTYSSALGNYSSSNIISSDINKFTIEVSSKKKLLDADTYFLGVLSVNGSNEDKNNYNFTYGSVSYTITPRQISIKPVSDSKIYDGKAYYYDSSKFNYVSGSKTLCGNDQITISVNYKNSSGSQVTSPTDAGNYTISVTSINFASGKSSNYNFVDSREAELIINRRSLILESNTDYIVYDDNSKASTTYDAKYRLYQATEGNYSLASSSPYSLIDGEEFKVKVLFNNTNSKIVNAGTYSLYISTIEGCGSTNLSNYIISYNQNVTYTILKANITINRDDISYIYSGKNIYEDSEVDLNSYLSSEGLVSLSHEVISNYVKGSSSPYAKDVGTYNNLTPVIIVDKNNIDVTSNYNLSYSNGTISISRREVTLAPNSSYVIKENNYYDGNSATYKEEVGNYEVKAGSFVNGESIKIDPKYFYATLDKIKDVSIIDAGTYYLYFDNGGNVLEIGNYKVTFYDGDSDSTYSVSPRDVTITLTKDYITNNNVNYYDGNYRHYDCSKPNYQVISTLGMVGEENIIVLEDYIYFGNESSTTGVKDAATYTLKIDNNGDFYSIVEGSGFKKSNYNISVSNNNTFRIEPRKIYLSPDTSLVVYENSEVEADLTYDADSREYLIKEGNYLDKEEGNYHSIVSGESFKVIWYFNNNKSIVNAGTYLINFNSITSENTSLSNYDITYDNSTYYTISQRAITITRRGFGDYIYDGINVYDKVNLDSKLSGDNLVTNSTYNHHTHYVKNNYQNDVTAINAGTYTNLTPVKIVDENNVNVTNNYSFSYVNEEFTIGRREITVVPDSSFVKKENKYYDGKEAYYSESDNNNFTVISETKMVEGDTLIVDSDYFYATLNGDKSKIKDAGTYNLYFNNGGKSVLLGDNYEVYFGNSIVTYEVKKREVTITVNLNYVISVDKNNNIIEKVSYYDGNYRKYLEATSNYSIVNGSLDMVGEESFTVLADHVDFDDVISTTGVKDAGNYKLHIIYDGGNFIKSGSEVNGFKLSNYNIKVEEVTSPNFTIDKRKVKLNADLSKNYIIHVDDSTTLTTTEYDGRERTYVVENKNYSVEVSGEYLNMVEGESFSLQYYFTLQDEKNWNKNIINIGKYYVGSPVVLDSEGGAKESNYEISYDKQEYEITKREIKITRETLGESTYSGKDYYDVIAGEKVSYDKTNQTSNNGLLAYLDDSDSKLLTGHRFVISSSWDDDVYMIKAGDYENKTPVVIWDSDDNDVSKNYNITYENERNIIKKATLKLRPLGKTYECDFGDNFDDSGKVNIYESMNQEFSSYVYLDGLSDSDNASFNKNSFDFTKTYYAGEYNLPFLNNLTIINKYKNSKYGDLNVTDSYDIKTIDIDNNEVDYYQKFNISKFIVYVKSQSANFVENGEKHYWKKFDVTNLDKFNNKFSKFNISVSVSDAEQPYYLTGDSVLNELTFMITKNGVKVAPQAYQDSFKYSYSSIGTLKRCSISELCDRHKVYDGQTYYSGTMNQRVNMSPSDSEGGEVYLSANIEVVGGATGVGTYSTRLTPKTLYYKTASGKPKDITSYYQADVNDLSCNFIVETRKIGIKTNNSITATYSGEDNLQLFNDDYYTRELIYYESYNDSYLYEPVNRDLVVYGDDVVKVIINNPYSDNKTYKTIDTTYSISADPNNNPNYELYDEGCAAGSERTFKIEKKYIILDVESMDCETVGEQIKTCIKYKVLVSALLGTDDTYNEDFSVTKYHPLEDVGQEETLDVSGETKIIIHSDGEDVTSCYEYVLISSDVDLTIKI